MEIARDAREIEKEEEEGKQHQTDFDSGADHTKRLQPWTKQLTLRGLFASIVVGAAVTLIAMKLFLTVGLIPNLNTAAALFAFIFIYGWTKLLEVLGFSSLPFTKQENVMIQTCAVACYSVVGGGGFGSYMLALNKKTYETAGETTPGNSPGSYRELKLGWVTGYTFLACLVGLFVLIPLRKILIVGYKLPYPSGTATAVLINGFHSKGVKSARKQVHKFLKFFSLSFFWSFFQWFFTGKGICGFNHFPTFGLKALKQTFYFDFSMTFVGTGMIVPHLVNLSLLFGAVISWGLMWPLIRNHKGDWFPKDISEDSMKSLSGYRIFISTALILGDGLYQFVKIVFLISKDVHSKKKQSRSVNIDEGDKNESPTVQKENEVFVRESIPMWIAGVGYVFFSIISIIFIPVIFHQVKWYYIVVAYILAPIIAFCNAYGTGLTDQNMGYNYGKVALFVFAAISGKENGVVAGLVACGLVKSMAHLSSSLMQDFKTGHLTLSSPRALFLSQFVGTIIGCIIAPLCFFMFYNAFDVGNPQGEYKAPYAIIYRNLAIIGAEGISALPRHCLQLCYGFFAFAVAANLVKDTFPSTIGKLMPLPMVMALPLLTGAYFAIDMCVGSLVVFVWKKINPNKAKLMITAVACGLICGEGVWSLPASLLSLAKVRPPICMTFLKS